MAPRILKATNRNEVEIRVWMLRKGILVKDIQEKARVSLLTASRTIIGLMDNEAVLRVLLEMGCPEKLLDLPKGMKTDEAA